MRAVPHELVRFDPDELPFERPFAPPASGLEPEGDQPGIAPAASEALPLRFWADSGTVAPPDRLVRRLLGTTALTMFYGPPACGKSFLAVIWACTSLSGDHGLADRLRRAP